MGRFNFVKKDEPDEVDYSANNNNASGGYDAPSGSYSYEEHLAELWKLIIFCIVGWVVAVIGFCILGTTASGVGILFVLVGVIIVDLPAFRILLAGGSLGTLIGSIVGATQIITYTDGSTKEDNSGWSAGLFVTIMTWLATIFVGLVSIVVRIFKNFLACMRIKKEEGIETDVKHAPWLPMVVGISVFILGCIVNSIVTSAYGAIESSRDEFTDPETITMISDMVDGMKTENYEFVVWDGSDKVINVKNVLGIEYAVIITAEGAEYFGISEGTYTYYYSEGIWRYNNTIEADAAAVAVVEKYTIEKLINYDYIIGEGIAKVTAITYGTAHNDGGSNSNYRFTVHAPSLSGDTEYIFEGGMMNGEWVIRRIIGSYSTSEYTDIDIQFK